MSELLSKTFQKIRIDFLFHHPFLSVLAMSLPLEFCENLSCAMQTDGRRIFVDHERLGRYGESEIKYQFAHVLLHVILKHPFRMQRRDRNIWNLASDLVVNLILANMKSIGKRPSDEPLDERYKDKSVEEVYAILMEQQREQPKKSEESTHKIDLLPASQEEGSDEEALDSLLIQALNIARQQGVLAGTFGAEVERFIAPQIDLDEILRDYLHASLFEKTGSFERPNRRHIHRGLYLPGVVRPQKSLHATIAIDASLSVSEEEFALFLGTVREVLQQHDESVLHILPFDVVVHTESELRIWPVDPLPERFSLPKGEGGTDFDCVIDYLESHVHPYESSLLIVLSDGYFEIRKNNRMEKLFLITQKENLGRFESYGKVVPFRV